MESYSCHHLWIDSCRRRTSPVPTSAQPLLQPIYQTRVEPRTSIGQARPGSCALLARMASCSVPPSLRAASAAASSSRRRCRHWSLQASLSTLQEEAVLQEGLHAGDVLPASHVSSAASALATCITCSRHVAAHARLPRQISWRQWRAMAAACSCSTAATVWFHTASSAHCSLWRLPWPWSAWQVAVRARAQSSQSLEATRLLT